MADTEGRSRVRSHVTSFGFDRISRYRSQRVRAALQKADGRSRAVGATVVSRNTRPFHGCAEGSTPSHCISFRTCAPGVHVSFTPPPVGDFTRRSPIRDHSSSGASSRWWPRTLATASPCLPRGRRKHPRVDNSRGFFGRKPSGRAHVRGATRPRWWCTMRALRNCATGLMTDWKRSSNTSLSGNRVDYRCGCGHS